MLSQPLINIFRTESLEYDFDSVTRVFAAIGTPLDLFLLSVVMVVTNAVLLGLAGGFAVDLIVYLKSELFP